MSLLNHRRLNHGDAKQFFGQHCVYKTAKKDHLKQHVRSQHEKVMEICAVCGKGFSEKSYLNKHVRTFHTEIEQNDKKSEVTENENKRKSTDTLENEPKKSNGCLRCSTCTAEFKELKNLNKLIKNMHGVKNIKCDNCAYTTNDSYNFQRHKEGCKKRKKRGRSARTSSKKG